MQQMVVTGNTRISALLAASVIIIFPPPLSSPVILRYLSTAYVESSRLPLALCLHLKATQHSLDLASATCSLIHAWDLSYNFYLLWLALLDAWDLLLNSVKALFSPHFSRRPNDLFLPWFYLGVLPRWLTSTVYHGLLSKLATAGHPRNAPPLAHFCHVLCISSLAEQSELDSKSVPSSVDILFQNNNIFLLIIYFVGDSANLSYYSWLFWCPSIFSWTFYV